MCERCAFGALSASLTGNQRDGVSDPVIGRHEPVEFFEEPVKAGAAFYQRMIVAGQGDELRTGDQRGKASAFFQRMAPAEASATWRAISARVLANS